MTSRDDLPPILPPLIDMKKPNEVVHIHQGVYVIRSGQNSLEVNGEIKYQWFPNPGIYFYGTPVNPIQQEPEIFKGIQLLQIEIAEKVLGEGFFTHTTFHGDEKLAG